MLAATDVVGGYARDEQILKGASIRVDPGEIVVIIGPNGAGKSTLLKAVAGLVTVQSGAIVFDGADVTRLDAMARARAGLAFVPQERNVFATMSVAENLSISAFLDPRAEAARVAELAGRYPLLTERRHALARTLSGGQRQILAMAMGLMAKPRLMLLDEPTAGLSPRAADELFAAIVDLNRAGLPMLMVEQHAIEALAIAARAYVMVAGKVSAEGPGPALADDPQIRRLFLGG
ncbi:MAG: ABC transporter ATP-binding protein [Methylobacteriaceae bacterium]|nr:ABC transporter ATP-binding protein [Methylobacteriaceae bacterium]